MKTIYFLQFFVIFSFVILVSSCEPHDCPDPVDPTNTTTYVVTLDGADFIDAQVSSFVPTTNFGSYPVNAASAWTNGGTPFTERGFVKFNYSDIPSGATITKATLTLHADTTNVNFGGHSTLSGANNWNLRRITSSWDAGTLTWDNQPSGDLSTQMELPASTSYKQTYTIDVTNFVKEEISVPASAHGFMFQLVTESYYRTIRFASSDFSEAALRPTLVIEYTK